MGQHHIERQKDLAFLKSTKNKAVAHGSSPPPLTGRPEDSNRTTTQSENPLKTRHAEDDITSGERTDGEGEAQTQPAPKRDRKSSFKLADVLEVGRKIHRVASTKAPFGRRQRVKRGVRWGVIGVRNSLAEDFQFHCLDMEWGPLLALVFSAYFACSCLFAAAFYHISVICEERHHLMGEIPDHMSLAEACFWFSVNNLLTIGYGAIVPGSRTACIITTLEHFTGIMMSSLLLGIVVTKASLPSSKIVFSQRCLITTRNGVPFLLIRVGNTRGNFLTQPEIRLAYLLRVVTVEGEVTFKSIRMEFVDPPTMAPCINLAHQIDENSPLYGKSPADIQKDGGVIFVSISATDELSMQTVFARQLFRSEEVLLDHRFQDVLVSRNGTQYVDFRRFHDVVPVLAPTSEEASMIAKRLSEKTFEAFRSESTCQSSEILKPAMKANSSDTGEGKILGRDITPTPALQNPAPAVPSRIPTRLPNTSFGVERPRAPVGA